MKRWFVVMAVLTIPAALVVLLGFGTLAGAGTKADFALFDNTNPATRHEGIQCTGNSPFTYYISVSNFPGPSVLRLTYHDGDLTRFNIPLSSSFSISGASHGKSPKNPLPADSILSICGESPTVGQLAGQMSILSVGDGASCINICCSNAGVPGAPEGALGCP